MSTNRRTLVAIATYNEIDNLPGLVNAVLKHAPYVDILVIDDNSPDGTGRWCDEQAVRDKRLQVLHRPSKLGLGSATLAAIHQAMDRDYQYLLTLDADFSHPPRFIPELLESMGGAGREVRDVAIGSRYVEGGAVEGWPLARRWMSRLLNAYARWMLGLPVWDCSGAFRCFRVDALRTIDWDRVQARGYAFLEEILWHLHQREARFAEVPIVFVDRKKGKSKISVREAISAVWTILRLGLLSRLTPGRWKSQRR